MGSSQNYGCRSVAVRRVEIDWGSGFPQQYVDKSGNYVTMHNEQNGKGGKFDQLYYIKSSELTGNDHETSLDGSHPTDIGQVRFASIFC